MHEAEQIVRELLDALGAQYDGVAVNEIAGQNVIAVTAEDGRALIGARGDTIHALDLLAKKIYEKRFPPKEGGEEPALPDASRGGPLFLVDVNDYRSKQIKDLQSKALMLAERARSFQYDVELTPMSAYERLIIHTTLQGAPHVKTESQGEGRNRRVVIKYSVE